ncbi:hypothetical protein D1224_00465 [Henriciella barbarensis]|uniref:DNA-directed DNA polymerase family A palm domain-containing protein n=1 Tax=Henriciella barbarensis TaxID=86342 RepID=A0A399R8A2_9PROT|nr:hypothetical protein [Henriciella barbarensis]RIJ26127.1 hypothetical protein D1224_00465 [Henriciella barbarensis]
MTEARKPFNDKPINWNRVPASDRMRCLVSEATKDADDARRERSTQSGKQARALRPAFRDPFEAAVSMLVCNCTQEYLLGGGFGVYLSLDVALLGRQDLLKPLAESSGLPKRVKELESKGWLNVEWGRRSASQGRRQTVLRAGEMLQRRIALWSVEDTDVVERLLRSPVIAQGRSHDAASFNSPRVTHVQAEMVDINKRLINADIRWTSPLDGVDLSQRTLHRSFRDEACTLGGRMAGGFWFQMSKQSRFDYLCLQGERPVELDYSGIMLRIAYALEKTAPPRSDVYAIPGLEAAQRDDVKKLVNAMIWDEKPRTRLPRGTAPAFRPMTGRFASALVLDHHQAVQPWLQCGRGLELQRYESDIISRATRLALESGFVALPVHDALYVPYSKTKLAEEIMRTAFKDICGGEAMVVMTGGAEAVRGEMSAGGDLFEDA